MHINLYFCICGISFRHSYAMMLFATPQRQNHDGEKNLTRNSSFFSPRLHKMFLLRSCGRVRLDAVFDAGRGKLMLLLLVLLLYVGT